MPRICLRFIFPLRKSTPINAAQTASERASDDETPAISTIEYTGGGGVENLTYCSNELRQRSCPYSVAVWAASHSHTVCVHMVWLRVLYVYMVQRSPRTGVEVDDGLAKARVGGKLQRPIDPDQPARAPEPEQQHEIPRHAARAPATVPKYTSV